MPGGGGGMPGGGGGMPGGGSSAMGPPGIDPGRAAFRPPPRRDGGRPGFKGNVPSVPKNPGIGGPGAGGLVGIKPPVGVSGKGSVAFVRGGGLGPKGGTGGIVVTVASALEERTETDQELTSRSSALPAGNGRPAVVKDILDVLDRFAASPKPVSPSQAFGGQPSVIIPSLLTYRPLPTADSQTASRNSSVPSLFGGLGN